MATHDELVHVLLALAAIVLSGLIVGRAIARFGQPAVIGEMFAGIFLGPSLLGRIWPQGMQFLLPASITPHLRVIAQIGVVLYMFLVGLELDLTRLRDRARSAVVISFSGIAVPLVLGSLLAGYLHRQLGPEHVPVFLFGAFFCVALSVTAFPVLARIVADRKLEHTAMGVMALTCAAAGDIAAWCMLSIVVSFARSAPHQGVWTVSFAALYVLTMLGLVRPYVLRFVARQAQADSLSRGTLAGLFIALLTSALITEWIGIHALFGAFLLGALVPHDSKLARSVIAKLEDVVAVLLLPVFFAATGLRMRLDLVSGEAAWFACGLIVLAAFAGKFGGVFTAARICGIDTRTSLGLGALMNTRGLMELIVLNVGLDLGIISPSLFTMMVIMALITTCAAGPVLSLLARRSAQQDSAAVVL